MISPEPPAEVRSVVDYNLLVTCIIMVEGHRWKDRGGALGWQPAAWKEDARGLPFSEAQNPVSARLVAIRRLERMAGELAKRGKKPTVQNLAQVWRSGLTGVVSGRPREPDYGQRVANLYFAAGTR